MLYTDEVDNEELILWETMAWSAPRYSRTKVDAAGQFLIMPPSLLPLFSDKISTFSAEEDVMEIVNNWRASHNLPLFVIRKTLEKRAKRISRNAIVAQRIKRLPSISRKLRDNQFRHLKLSQIQDIGGCRAIMSEMDDVFHLVEVYRMGRISSEFVRANDYIAQPKDDGYRSIHLVYKYKSESAQYRAFDNQRIEIQIRSQLQHAWATALETVETFTQMELRRKAGTMLLRPKEYLTKWRRFFALMASAIAFREGQPIVPGTPENEQIMLEEMRGLGEELHVVQTLLAWRNAVSAFVGLAAFQKEAEEKMTVDPYWFLLQLDPKKESATVKAFKKEDNLRAFDEYVNAEKPKRDAPSTQVVLVSVDSIAELKKAYPNYFADTSVFVGAFLTARDHNNSRHG
jgi:ppGpp synthetase/RelA/SpoT-type nucleotidyltranferase